MTTPAIITVAITGAIPRKADTPAVPIAPSEQIESTHEAYEAGASVAIFTSVTATRHRVPIRICSRKCRKESPGTVPA
jgi:hypothetical protein